MSNMGFLFPGQGAQHIGMGEILCKEYKTARETFEEASEYGGIDMKRLCFEGGMTQLNQLENMFCAILTCSVASFRVYMEKIGISPGLTAGHSIGEYAALVCAGAISFEDAVKLAKYRGKISQRIVDTGKSLMAIVNRVPEEVLGDAVGKISRPGHFVGISCYNSELQFAVSGDTDAVLQLQDTLMDKNGEVTPLFMSAPFHSERMAEAAAEMKKELLKYTYGDMRWPVISNVYALPYGKSADLAEILSAQLTNPVQWVKTIKYMDTHGCDIYIEMGPQAILSNMLRPVTKSDKIYSFGQKDDRDALIQEYGEAVGGDKGVYGAQGFIGKCLAIAVSTKNTNWEKEEYRKGVILPYEEIEKVQVKLDETGSPPSREQMVFAVERLKIILNTKNVTPEEQNNLFRELFTDIKTRDLWEESVLDSLLDTSSGRAE